MKRRFKSIVSFVLAFAIMTSLLPSAEVIAADYSTGAFEIISPSDGDTINGANTVIIEWESYLGADHYWITIKDESTGEKLINEMCLENSYSVSSDKGVFVDDEHKYKIYVAAMDKDDNVLDDYSAWQIIYVTNHIKLDVPELTSHSNSEICKDNKDIILEWDSVELASYYVVNVMLCDIDNNKYYLYENFVVLDNDREVIIYSENLMDNCYLEITITAYSSGGQASDTAWYLLFIEAAKEEPEEKRELYSHFKPEDGTVRISNVPEGHVLILAGYENGQMQFSYIEKAETSSVQFDVPKDIFFDCLMLYQTDENFIPTAEPEKLYPKAVYKDDVKLAEQDDYAMLADNFVTCWIDDNGTAQPTDDTIVLLVGEKYPLLYQIEQGQIKPGEVYLIPQNDLFPTGFSGIYLSHRSPKGTDAFPAKSYPDSEFEEIIFEYPSYSDLFDGSVTFDFSEGIDWEEPVAFAYLADGTAVELVETTLINETNIALMSNSDEKMELLEVEGPGWQLQNLLAAPTLKYYGGNDSSGNLVLECKNLVLFDADGNEKTTSDQFKVDFSMGLKNMKFTGYIAESQNILPDQTLAKLDYTLDAQATIKAAAGIDTASLIEATNLNFENKIGTKGLAISGVKTLKDKVVLGVVGLNLLPPTPITGTSMSNVAVASTLSPCLFVVLFLDLNGNISIEISSTVDASIHMVNGFNMQKESFTGEYGSADNLLGDERYYLGDYVVDIYKTSDGSVKVTNQGKISGSIKGGIGAGIGLMMCGLCPAMVSGEVFSRIEGQLSGKQVIDVTKGNETAQKSGNAFVKWGLGCQVDLDFRLAVDEWEEIGALEAHQTFQHMFAEYGWSIASVTGTVRENLGDDDPSDNPVLTNVLVTLTREDTGETRSTTTDSYGIYTFDQIIGGMYTMTFEKLGYDTLVLEKQNLSGEIVMTKPDVEDSEAGFERKLLSAVYLASEGSGLESEVEDSDLLTGTIGDLTWTLNYGVLTISGLGEMKSNFTNQGDLYTHKKEIKKVIINSGISKIGVSAFSGCENLTEVIIPDTVTEIGQNSFYNCVKLEKIIIPDTVTKIGSSAFENCISLKTVKIPNNVSVIGSGAFRNCTELYDVQLSDNLLSVQNFTFAGCTKLTCINLSSNITSIGASAFADCVGLQQIEIGGNLTQIGESAFEECTALTTIDILQCVEVIGNNAFRNCTALVEFTLPNGLKNIGRAAFYQCSALKELRIPSTVHTIGVSAFQNCTGLISIYFEDNLSNATEILTKIPEKAFYGCSSLKDLRLREGITDIGVEAFRNCIIDDGSNFPNTLNHIEGYAFSGCSMTTVVLPEGVTRVGQYAFYCNPIKTLTLPKSLNSVGEYGFYKFLYMDGISRIYYYGNLDEWCQIGFQDGTLFSAGTQLYLNGLADTCLTVAKISDDVTEIGAHVFENYAYLTEVHIPASVVEIGKEAFAGCSGLKTAYFYGEVPSWGEGSVLHYEVFDELDLNSFMIRYVQGIGDWTTPTWTSPAGTVFQTAPMDGGLTDNLFVAGKTYVQRTIAAEGLSEIPANHDLAEDPPYFRFIDEQFGYFYIVYWDGWVNVCGFTYTVSGNEITVLPDPNGQYPAVSFNGATKLILRMENDGTLSLESYTPDVTDFGDPLEIGWTTQLDIFSESRSENGRPFLFGSPNGYYIPSGKTVQLNGTVHAYGDGLITRLVLVHDEEGTSFAPRSYFLHEGAEVVDMTVLGSLSTDEYPFNKKGNHRFLLYAYSNNDSVPEKPIAVFSISSEGSQ